MRPSAKPLLVMVALTSRGYPMRLINLLNTATCDRGIQRHDQESSFVNAYKRIEGEVRKTYWQKRGVLEERDYGNREAINKELVPPDHMIGD